MSPPVSTKPLATMSLAELHAERACWDEYIGRLRDRGYAPGTSLLDLLLGFDVEIARRPIEGSVPQPGTPAPDTPDLPSDPPNGIIIGSVSLRPHRVPVLGADPASGVTKD